MLDKIKSYRFELALVIITFITSLLMLTTFEYNDCESLTAWSVELWDCLVQGKLGDFYIYAAQNLRGAAHGQCLGSFLFLIPQAIIPRLCLPAQPKKNSPSPNIKNYIHHK